MNPILSCAESDSDTSAVLFRDRGDGLEEDEDSGVKIVHDDSDIIIHAEPDSDFDDFNSNEDEEACMEVGETGGSQDNEIHEIYLVQDSKQTKILGKYIVWLCKVQK